ncbi:MAG TPA: hypothetical protein PKA64_22970, partial [Myxococcota bacterium]|nr:hypothetical protein [Myxococcota bacterium]
MGSHEMWFAALLLLSPARALATPSCESRATGPGEVPGNNVDEDGDGCAACYLDADRDGYGAGLIQIELRRLGAAPCTLRLGCPSGSPCPVPKGGDCMPDDAAVHPHQAQDATHGPFGRDVDCDAATPFWGYADQDGDTSPGTLSVGAGGERPDDCDDDDPLVHPDAAEAS